MGEVDGRRERRAGNRQAALDALVELFGDDRFQPSTAEIAERAGISARSLFRYFDAAKPGPVGWADALFKTDPTGRVRWSAAGLGILFDDLVAAFCTLFVIALWRAFV